MSQGRKVSIGGHHWRQKFLSRFNGVTFFYSISINYSIELDASLQYVDPKFMPL